MSLFICIGSFCLAKAEPDVPKPAFQLLYFSFDEGEGAISADLSGRGNDTMIEGTAEWTQGVLDGRIKLDGKSGYIKTPVSHRNLDTFTVSIWIKPLTMERDMRIWGHKDDHRRSNWLPVREDGRLSIRIRTRGTDPSGTSESIIDSDNWHNIAVVWAESRASVYVNGTLVIETDEASSTDISPHVGDFIIGAAMEPPQQFFEGKIDEVRF